jgi:DNA modification methylase
MPLQVPNLPTPPCVGAPGPFTRKGKFITPQGPFCKEKQWHPHQQPLALFQHLVREYTDPGDLIVDPCGGGFTTAEACLRLGRRCICCDVDAVCVSKGLERMEMCQKQIQIGA